MGAVLRSVLQDHGETTVVEATGGVSAAECVGEREANDGGLDLGRWLSGLIDDHIDQSDRNGPEMAACGRDALRDSGKEVALAGQTGLFIGE